MKNNQEFKQTEIGRIPKEWEVVRLGEKKVCEVLYYGITAKATDENTGIKMLRTTDIKHYSVGWETLPFCKITEKRNDFSKYLLRQGDLIVARAGTVGVSVLVDKDFNDTIFGSYLIKVRLKSTVNPKFIHYFFQSPLYWKHLQGAQGSTLKNINLPLLKSLKLPLPPLPEQKKIAEILSTVDKGVEKVDEAINKTQRLKKGLMQELLTGRRNTVDGRQGRREFKQTEIGRIPKEWEVVKLGDALELCQYGLSVQIKEQGKYPIIKMDDISNGYVVEDNIKYADLDEQTYKNFKLDKGDILFNRTNSYELVGRTGVFQLNGNYVFASYLIRLKPKHDIANSHFLTFYLIFKNDRIRQLATRAVHQANINATNLQKFKLPLPPLPEQKKIAEILGTVDKRLELLRKRKEKLERVKKGLMDYLLSGKKRVTNLISKEAM